MNKYTALLLLSAAAVLGGCATETPLQSNPAYVPPSFYESYNCKQLKAEKIRLTSKIEQSRKTDATGQVLTTALFAYAISQGQSVYQEDDSELQRLQNQYDVLEQTSIQKECN